MNKSELERYKSRKKARILYLELCALRLDVTIERDAGGPNTYRLVVGGLCSLSPRHAEKVVRLVRENETELARMLLDVHDSDLYAIRTEGRLG